MRDRLSVSQRLGLWLSAALITAVAVIQAWLLHARWINADEGAHLMDALFVMDGLIPSVDFSARQALYVLSYVPVLKLLGANLVAARLMPLLATFSAAGVLFLTGRRLWSSRVGFAAAIFYLCAPTVFINAVVVKTEPLTILMTCLGMLGLVTHLQKGRWLSLGLAGAAFGLGYYIRHSALAGLLAAILVCVWFWRQGFVRMLQRIAVLISGWALVCMSVAAFYLQYLSLGEVLTRKSVFPPYVLLQALLRIGDWVQPSTSTASFHESVRHSAQDWFWTLHNFMEPVLFSLPLLVGVVISLCLLFSRKHRKQENSLGTVIGIAWLGSFLLLYAYHFFDRGFFQFYFREFIPPMALLTAGSVAALLRGLEWERHLIWVLPGAIFTAGAVILARVLGPAAARIAAVTVVGAMAVWAVTMGQRALMRSPARVAGLMAFVIAGMVSAVAAAPSMRVDYDCSWSPKTLDLISRAVAKHSAAGDKVISGGVIWEFEADRRPILSISHPLVYINGMSRKTLEALREYLAETLPAVVVLDGYTERIYLEHLPEMKEMMEHSYDFVVEAKGSRYPVQVFALRRSGASAGEGR